MFLPLLRIPRKITREVQNRLAAVEILHLAASVCFAVLFTLIITRLGYAVPFVENPGSIPLNAVIITKMITCFVLFFTLYNQTDVVLCLHHFGCFAFCMARVKRYWRQQRDILGSDPVMFAVKPKTLRNLLLLKFVDWSIGVLGWVGIWRSLGKVFFVYGPGTQAVIVAFVFTLVLIDIWSVLLIGVIVRLYNTYMERRDEDAAAAEDSSDSELDEMHVAERHRLEGTHARQPAQDKQRQQQQQSSSTSSGQVKLFARQRYVRLPQGNFP